MANDSSLTGIGRLLGVSSLRAAIIVATAWALGTLALTLLSLVVEAREYGWHGLVAPANLLYALLFATASYLLRFLRWHILAKRVAPDLSWRASFLVGAIGFGLITTPGRVGEALKLGLLRERTQVPIATSAPVFLVEKSCEAIALAGLAVAASLFLPWAESVEPNAKLALAGMALLALVAAVALRTRVEALVPRLPLARRLLRRPGVAMLWSHLVEGGDRVLTWGVLLSALAVSVVARLCDGVAIFWIAGLYGIELSLAGGWFLIGSSGFLGGVSMLPGGAGVAEATLIGLLLAFGAGPAAAVAAALTSRVLIFWLWVALGLALAARYAVHPWRRPAEEAG